MNWGVYTSQSEEIVRKQRKRMKDLGQEEWGGKKGNAKPCKVRILARLLDKFWLLTCPLPRLFLSAYIRSSWWSSRWFSIVRKSRSLAPLSVLAGTTRQ